MPTQSISWVNKTLAVARKDIVSEFRTRYAINAIVMFALVTLTVISFSVGLLSPSKEILSALFWVILFFASMSGLAQAFIKEEETGTAMILRLSCEGSIVFFGKMLFNFLLLLTLSILIVPLFIVFLKVVPTDWSLFIGGILMGLIGLSGATTIIAAIVSKASVQGALFTVLSFPVLLPLLVAVIEITTVSFTGGTFADASAPLQLLVAYDVIMITLSSMLFDFVWRL
ncbi:MAG: ABC transporter permease [candidate division Zixibacteria bacterium]|nr:ABC transporter permease [candidate division Zixibacteria bacterium]